MAPLGQAGSGRVRRPTSTTRFGSSRRESHDASAFYERFVAPQLSRDELIVPPKHVDVVYEHDARHMHELDANSVALVVTSPPYFAGKEYEESLGQAGVPATYFEYLELLHDVFDECKRVLEPGGRVAVNVANLGRRPFRSLAGDVTDILQDLGLLLRGEVVWWKGRAAGGSCAWGTFQRPRNPVLRDVTERLVIASKGRFDRAIDPEQRRVLGLPSTATISRDEFLEATTDLWEIPPESATRVGHPAPFPVALPQRVIELYTYEGDLVLDPFMGSGTTAVAALRTGRHYVGFETDATYIERCRERIAEEVREDGSSRPDATLPFAVRLPAVVEDGEPTEPLARAGRDGLLAKEFARVLLEQCGFEDIRADVKLPRLGIDVSFIARDGEGEEWAFELAGTFTSSGAGLRRADALWRVVGKASIWHQARGIGAFVVLTTDAPAPRTASRVAVDLVTGPDKPITDVIELLDTAAHERLRSYATGGRPS